MSIQNYNPHATYSIGKDGGINYQRNTQDGHGGYAAEHRREMQDLARNAVYEYAPQIAAQIYNQSLSQLVGAMQYDIETIVNVSMDDFGRIFQGSACRKVISDRIVQQLKCKIGDLTLNL